MSCTALLWFNDLCKFRIIYKSKGIHFVGIFDIKRFTNALVHTVFTIRLFHMSRDCFCKPKFHQMATESGQKRLSKVVSIEKLVFLATRNIFVWGTWRQLHDAILSGQLNPSLLFAQFLFLSWVTVNFKLCWIFSRTRSVKIIVTEMSFTILSQFKFTFAFQAETNGWNGPRNVNVLLLIIIDNVRRKWCLAGQRARTKFKSITFELR